MGELGSAVFLSWVRGSITKDSEPPASGHLPRLRAKVGIEISTTAASEPGSAEFDLLGPADATGFSPSQILRTDPKAGEPAAEPNYLCSIEFDAPELPWLLSPFPSKPEAVQPWMALVVVVDEPGRLEQRAGAVNPVLRCPATDLPPCAESWAWAHAQIIPDGPRPIQEMLIDLTEAPRTLSRLICPTRLKPNTGYLACVVPTYAAGVAAILGGDPADAGDKPAWGTSGQVVLPTFLHWKFRTGPVGDFEEIATELKAVKAESLPGIGRSALAIAPGGLPGLEGDPPPVPAVRTLLTTTAEIDAMAAETVPDNVRSHLAEIISPDAVPADPPVVQPPAYGRWPAQLDHIGPETEGWISGINLAPSHRVIARLGGDVVRTQQEELVAEARRQAGAYQAARRARDLLRLGELTATRLIQRRFTDVASAKMIALARPAHFAIPFDDTTNVADKITAATVDPGMLAPALTQIASRTSRRIGVTERSIRTGLVTGAFDHAFRSPDNIPAEQSTNFDRVREVYVRANLLDRVVGTATIGKLLNVAPQAATAQAALVQQLSTIHVDLHEQDVVPIDPGAVVEGGVAVAQPPPFTHAINIGQLAQIQHIAQVQDVVQPEAIENIAHLAGEQELVHLAGEQELIHPVVDEQLIHAVGEQKVAQPAGGGIQINQGISDVVFQRISEADRSALSNVVISTLQPAISVMGQPEAAQPIAVAPFVLDNTAATLGKTFREAVGGPSLDVQVSVKATVRAQLGLATVAPMHRDLLPVDIQGRFDQAVSMVTQKTLLPSVAYPAATNVVALNDVATACTSGLSVTGTYTKAVQGLLRRAGEALFVLPTEINLGFVPTFTAPLASRLERSLNSWILAGASSIPANGVTLVSTNPAFIEAFVAGANHEVAGEMLWRDVPSDPRGTVFTRFWANSELGPIHKWTGRLGQNVDNGRPLVAVVLRSPLLRRYPNTVIYAAKRLETPGDTSFTPDPATITPVLYQGFIEPDATFSVLDLDVNKARDPDEKWFVLISQPVTDARFGLDEWIKTEPPPPPQDWNDLTWQHMGDATLSPHPQSPPQPQNPGNATWGASAADLALILHQDPFRIVLPAATYLPSPD
jgi:hypothetical protein